MPDDVLSDFEHSAFTHNGKTRQVFRLGSGPAVIVITEMPGISPTVAAFARRVASIGCTAVMPNLFGRAGYDYRAHGKASAALYAMQSVGSGCISREFTVLAVGKTSPIVDWLRALMADEHERCGGPGVGAIGMCWTGGYALALATDERLLAPVLSQPSMPFGLTKRHKASIDCSAQEIEIVKRRCAAQDLKVLGLRFKGDKFVPPERFQFLREQLGDAFVGVELDKEDANPGSIVPPHSVLTEHLIDEPGQPTRAALDQVLDLFRTKLLSP